MFGNSYEFEYEYRSSFLSKQDLKVTISTFNGPMIYLRALTIKDGNFVFEFGSVKIDEDLKIGKYSFGEQGSGIAVSGNTNSEEENSDYTNSNRVTYYLPDFPDYMNLRNGVEDAWNKEQRRKEDELERKRVAAEQRELENQRKTELANRRNEFLETEYISIKEQFPIFMLDEHDQYSTFIYIDNYKNLTIKSIDKYKMEAVASTINYPAIHYYEKAGNIHYVSKIDVEYDNSSIAASFVPTKIDMIPVVIGSLLLGPMGMALGAMAGFEGGHFEPKPDNDPAFRIKSETNRIDDRSVILNYYSDKNKQYTDIELPHEIYNYLQTHLAEKKYDIVINNEKQVYSMQGTAQIPYIQPQAIGMTNTGMIPQRQTLSLEEFEVAAKKLRLMVDNGLISESEFNEKRAELMNNIV